MSSFRDTRRFRTFECIPGALLWSTLIGGIVLSFVRPLWVITFIICFSFYWLLRVLYFVVYLVVSWHRYTREVQIDWCARVKAERPEGWERIVHCIFLPTYRESTAVLTQTLAAIAESAYPKDRFLIVLGGEERAGRDAFLARAGEMRERFGAMLDILVTVHPADLLGEIPGKGSNLHWMGEQVVPVLDARGIRHEDVIVSAFDVDTVVHPQYFAYLTWTFLHHPDRLHTSYQPVALYNNNMWESQAFMRVAAFGTTFWLLTELMRPDRLFTFSSHSMSLPALIDVGFWENNIVTEDSRIFLQCFIRYDGAYTVTPLFLPVSMHTAKAETLWRSIVNLYKQQRRWMWGVEHFPYMLWHFFIGRGRNIPLGKKLKYLWNLGEGMYSMATAPIILFLFSRIPLAVLAGRPEAGSVIAQTAPFMLTWILGIAMIGIFASALFSITLVPRRPEHVPIASWGILILQWLLLPFTLIVFGAIPAIEAQTRLMIGKYLGFYVSKKE